MRRWFLSYNTQDLALMQGLEGALRRKDSEAKIFFAPKNLHAGGFWLPELAKAIAEATAFVLLVGEKGLGPWQIIEYYEAVDRRATQHDFRIIPVLLDRVPAPGLPFLRQLQWIIAADPAAEESIAQIIDAAAVGGTPPGELWRHTAPYRGLGGCSLVSSLLLVRATMSQEPSLRQSGRFVRRALTAYMPATLWPIQADQSACRSRY
jgi:TIR domain